MRVCVGPSTASCKSATCSPTSPASRASCPTGSSRALKRHARWALTNERKIYFDEAGADPKGFPVEDVVIDLPVRLHTTGEQDNVIRHALDRGDRLLRPSLAAVDKPRHLVVVGAPGNGKTTVSRFLVHAYRAAWLGEDEDLGDEHRKAVTATAAALGAMSRRPPAHRRWPLRVDLAQFAMEKATDPDFTLLTFMAQTLSKQAPADRVTKAVLDQWLRAWPSFLILDGLDEVSEPSVRKGLIADVEAFVTRPRATTATSSSSSPRGPAATPTTCPRASSSASTSTTCLWPTPSSTAVG